MNFLPLARMLLCIKVDDRVRAHRSSHAHVGCEPVGLPGASTLARRPRELLSGEEKEEPMQLGRSRLSPPERQHRFAAGECVYCGRKGHSVSNRPALAKGRTHQ